MLHATELLKYMASSARVSKGPALLFLFTQRGSLSFFLSPLNFFNPSPIFLNTIKHEPDSAMSPASGPACQIVRMGKNTAVYKRRLFYQQIEDGSEINTVIP